LTNGEEFLKKFGYRVVRALDHYHKNNIGMIMSEEDVNKEDKMHGYSSTKLKVSVAAERKKPWSKTFEFDGSQLNDQAQEQDLSTSNAGGYVRNIDLPAMENSTKLYFLATGTGCATLKIKTAIKNHEATVGMYDISLDLTEESIDNHHIYLDVCVRLKDVRSGIEGINESTDSDNKSLPSSMRIEMFSGYDFVSLNGLYGQPNHVGGYTEEHKDNTLLLHLKRVTRRCGTCFNVKYRRHYAVQNLSPAKVSVFPTVWRYGEEYERTEASSMYFQIKSQPPINTMDMLQSSLTANATSKGFSNDTFSTGANSSIRTMPKSIYICPCSSQKCQDNSDLHQGANNMTDVKQNNKPDTIPENTIGLSNTFPNKSNTNNETSTDAFNSSAETSSRTSST
jgi:hypothetical protein